MVSSRRRFLEDSKGRGKDGSSSGGSKQGRSLGSGNKLDWRESKKTESGSPNLIAHVEKGEETISIKDSSHNNLELLGDCISTLNAKSVLGLGDHVSEKKRGAR